MEAADLVLRYGVVPLLVVAGCADWWCHRATRIEATSGLAENVFHWVLLGQIGVALLAAALLEVNAAVLLLVFGAFLAHELTIYIELHYTVPRREVRPGEQMVHSFMEVLPLALLGLLAVLHWDQALALLGQRVPDFGLRWKEEPWPAGYLLGVAAAVGLFNVLPLAEESWRCLRQRRAAPKPRTPAPPAPT
jgi:hypothetical protein